jgi:hypothetical protein
MVLFVILVIKTFIYHLEVVFREEYVGKEVKLGTRFPLIFLGRSNRDSLL